MSRVFFVEARYHNDEFLPIFSQLISQFNANSLHELEKSEVVIGAIGLSAGWKETAEIMTFYMNVLEPKLIYKISGNVLYFRMAVDTSHVRTNFEVKLKPGEITQRETMFLLHPQNAPPMTLNFAR